MFKITIFKSIFDVKTNKNFKLNSLEEFEAFFYRLSNQPGLKPKKGERLDNASALISPASYKKGTTRKNINVLRWESWAALDIDEYEGSFKDALRIFMPYYFICYSTPSSTKEKPKFRVILPLTKSVSANKIKHFWFALNTEFNSLGDKQTKDLSRMYYVPAQYPNANNFIFTNKKPLLNPKEIMNKHPYVDSHGNDFLDNIPEHIRKELEEYRKKKLTNTNISWVNYHNCPFVNQRQISEYRAITETGWYAKMYQIMVTIALNAIRAKYPITAEEIACLASEIDVETGGWYKNRNFKLEASRALSYALQKA